MSDIDKKNYYSVFSWSLKKEALEYQINNYRTLSVWKSARGGSLLVILFSLILTAVLAWLAVVNWATFIGGLILYLPVGILIYRGYLWPNIVVMVLWTLDKVVQMIAAPNFIVIIWWAVFMSVFYRSYQVEKARRSAIALQQPIPIPVYDPKSDHKLFN